MSRSYGGRSAEDRTAGRRSRLIDAGMTVVGTQGVAALGMRAVCREAGLSQKFFYENFVDTDALLYAVYGAALSQLEEAVRPALLADNLTGIIDAAAQLMERDPRICRILLIEPIADQRLRMHVRALAPAFGPLLLGGIVTGDPGDPKVRMRYSALSGAIISLFIEWTEGNLGDDRGAFVAHVASVAERLTGVTRPCPM
ncbi:TetR/AcrR family transcriptional regulator [Nocardia sp. CA-120079]|uniref:TetR/AcrR family transcriptional regulator n=1 Tax=Nocardia sp. CA-120079 TaxID=3239974 RepID=UPI003D97376C